MAQSIEAGRAWQRLHLAAAAQRRSLSTSRSK
jgi:hypothetical protein